LPDSVENPIRPIFLRHRRKIAMYLPDRGLNILSQLNEYTKSHFMEEEALLKENQYPALETHKNEHAVFIAKVSGFIQEFHTNNLSLNDEMLAFLKNWLIDHIMQTDKEYGAYLNERGVF
jgi:hemerythrin